MRLLFAALAAFMLTVLPLPAAADLFAPTPNGNGGTSECTTYLLCSGQTATGVCTAANAQCTASRIPFECCTGNATGTCTGDEISVDLRGRWALGLYASQSTATTFACNLQTTDAPLHDTVGDTPATIADPLDENDDTSTNLLWQTGRFRTIDAPLNRVWVTCPTISGGSVTITAESCPLGK